jgi:hypothetical protein
VPSYPKLWKGSYSKQERYTVEDAYDIVEYVHLLEFVYALLYLFTPFRIFLHALTSSLFFLSGVLSALNACGEKLCQEKR